MRAPAPEWSRLLGAVAPDGGADQPEYLHGCVPVSATEIRLIAVDDVYFQASEIPAIVTAAGEYLIRTRSRAGGTTRSAAVLADSPRDAGERARDRRAQRG